jgi:acyl-CoA synthetase (NDP forming)
VTETLPETDRAAVDRALDPDAVTIVGASDKSPITGQLVGNLRREGSSFGGRIQLVNRSTDKVLGMQAARSTAEIDSPGLVYMLIPGEACLASLSSFARRPDGVVLYPDASHRPDGYERELALWSAQEGVPIFGPQSNGVVNSRASLIGLLLPIADPLTIGHTSVLAQSGGILGTIVKSLLEAEIGLDVAIEYGTGGAWGFERLAAAMLGRDDTKVLALHIEDVRSLHTLANIARQARDLGKRLVLLPAGLTRIGALAAASHSGAASKPQRLIRDLISQYGAIYSESLDEMVTALGALDAVQHRQIENTGVLVVSDSGGGAVLLADALERRGIALPPPAAATRLALEAISGESRQGILNPYDFGAANIADLTGRQATLEALAKDSTYGLCVLVSTLGVPIAEKTLHIKHIASFIATVTAAGKVPVLAVPGPLKIPARPVLEGLGSFVVGRGTEASVFAIKALIAGGVEGAVDRVESVPRPHDDGSSISGWAALVAPAAAAELLAVLPVSWPASVTGRSDDVADEAAAKFAGPYVVKVEAGLAHRAVAGGVVGDVSSLEELRSVVRWLLGRFGSEVSVHACIEHDEEYFVGALRTDSSEVVVLAGLGGSVAESQAHALLAPFDERESRRLVGAFAVGTKVRRQLVDLLHSVQALLIAHSEIAAIDLNPVVAGRDGQIYTLDAKIHARVGPADHQTQDGRER